MSARDKPRVFSIPPGAPFLRTLVDSIRDGTLAGQVDNDDPSALSGLTIYLPTRRAVRSLRTLLVEDAGGRPAILPSIRALGDVDEDAGWFRSSPRILDARQPIGGHDRLMLLAQLVRRWRETASPSAENLLGGEIVLPASTADALWFARDLAELLDEAETENADWSKLATLGDRDVAEWWQLTREFLEILTRHWPDILAARGLVSPARHRDTLIRAEAERLLTDGASGPVIAAGSTGSIPATAAFLRAVSRLPGGAVVLPGLDMDIDPASFALAGSPEAGPASYGHPQAGLRRLLATLGVTRDDVVGIGAPGLRLEARARLVAEAMRPAQATELWAEPLNRKARQDAVAAGALEGVSLIEAANEADEARAIALALRDAIEDPDRRRTAALVTGDRILARRVSRELARYGVEADDSGGTLLSAAPAASLSVLLAAACLRPGDAATLQALVMHPLMHCGMSAADARSAARAIDLVALRGRPGNLSLETLGDRYDEALGHLEATAYRPRFLASIDDTAHDRARMFAAAIGQAAEPLLAMRDTGIVDTARAMVATVTCAEMMARDDTGRFSGLYEGDDGEAFAAFARTVIGAEDVLDFSVPEWPEVLEALLAGESVKPSPSGHPRLFIWGTLEARLQSVDTLVIGGLNEGTWPPVARSDRFLSRSMKAALGLEPPERRIALAAHDFQMAAGRENLILARSRREGTAPSTPSRWLRRLDAVAGADAAAAMRRRGNRYLDLARELDGNPEKGRPAPRPRPAPPAAIRPTDYTVSDIERLVRDPYAVYAGHVLQLEPLTPLAGRFDARDRGTVLHQILDLAVKDGIDLADADAADSLSSIMADAMRDAGLPPDIVTLWQPRFEKWIAEFIAMERDDPVARRIPETRAARTPVDDTGATLRARADRIDLLADGTARILDYKTGSNPSIRQAHILIAPQLALEAALLERGAFAAAGAVQASDLVYVRFKGSDESRRETILKAGKGEKLSEKTAAQLSAEAWEKLKALVVHFADPANGYVSRRMPFSAERNGDFDHLARAWEWMAEGDTGGGE